MRKSIILFRLSRSTCFAISSASVNWAEHMLEALEISEPTESVERYEDDARFSVVGGRGLRVFLREATHREAVLSFANVSSAPELSVDERDMVEIDGS